MIPIIISIFTVIIVYAVDRWENKNIQSVFDWFPAILLAYLIPASISFLMNVDYSNAPIHNWNKDLFIPIAIISVMSSLSLNQLKAIGWKPVFVFVIGSFWIAVFPIVSSILLRDSSFVQVLLLEEEYWKGLPPIVGSWIGGSTSQLVLKELVECPEEIFLTILIIDNFMVNIWTIFMFQSIKRSSTFNALFRISSKEMPNEVSNKEDVFLSFIITFSTLIVIVLVVNFTISSFIIKIIVLSFLGLLLSNFIKKWNLPLSLQIGSISILFVMAILGLKLKFAAINLDPTFLMFLITWLLGHFLIMILVAKILNVNMAWVPIASMANVGGIATAPAVTAAYEKKWMPHAIILAILSMATGTFWGILTIYLFKLIILKV